MLQISSQRKLLRGYKWHTKSIKTLLPHVTESKSYAVPQNKLST